MLMMAVAVLMTVILACQSATQSATNGISNTSEKPKTETTDDANEQPNPETAVALAPETVVLEFYKMMEKAFWDNTAAICKPGKSCYHYTQVVWKDTTEVGCGINRKASGKMKMLLVCNYDPAGNFPGPAY